MWGDYKLGYLSFVTERHPIRERQHLYTALQEIGNWECLGGNLGVPHSVLEGLRNETITNAVKKQRCLDAYYDKEDSCWEKVIEVVRNTFSKEKLANKIAADYCVN